MRRTPDQKKISTSEMEDDTRSNILRVATEEFAAHGLTGARVDSIAKRTRTTKGMIYYYFGSKEKLYISVIESIYLSIRSAEDNSRLAKLPPKEALTAFIETSFDFHAAHPHVARLISIENINNAKFIGRSTDIQTENRSVIATLDKILDAGVKTGIFRRDIEGVDVHYLISALCVFRISNRATFKTLFESDFADPVVCEKQRRLVVDAVMRAVSTYSEPNQDRIS